MALPEGTPILLDRRRIELVGPGQPVQAYHAAASSGLDAAAAAAREAGHEPTACGIVGEERELPPLAAILRSHPLLHAAEGQLARASVTGAAGLLGLVTLDVPARVTSDPLDAAALAERGLGVQGAASKGFLLTA